MVLFDTDVLIDSGRGNPDAIRVINQHLNNGIIAISVVTQMELIVGCQNKQELQRLKKFLTRFECTHINETISILGVELLEKYRLSHGLQIPDALIAATAIILQIPLISKNQRDFQFIQGLNLPAYP